MATFQHLCRSCVGSSLHSVCKSSSRRFGGSSIVYSLASILPRSVGPAHSVVWLDLESGKRVLADFACMDRKLSFLFPRLLPHSLRHSSFRSCGLVFRNASVAFRFWGVCGVCDSVLGFGFIVPVFFQFAILGLVVTISATVETVTPRSFCTFLGSVGAMSTVFSDTRVVSSGALIRLRCNTFSR